MGTYTNDTDGDLILPFALVINENGDQVLGAVALPPGETCEVPDPTPPLPEDHVIANMKVQDVHAYLEQHPGEVDRVVAIEQANKQRASILALAPKGDSSDAS